MRVVHARTVTGSNNPSKQVSKDAWNDDHTVISPAVTADSNANHNVTDDEDDAYLRMTAAGAKTVTFRPQSTHALSDNWQIHVRNAGANGDVTLTPGSGVTLNAPADGTLVLEPNMTVTVKRVASDTFDVIGQTTAA